MMPIRSLQVRGYRSIQRVQLRLGPVNVLEGANGCGKSNLYRSLYLLAAAAEGRFARTLANEGGMASALWAGEQIKGVSKRITIEVEFDQWSYHFACGLPMPSKSAFHLDPLIRSEELWFHDGDRKTSVFRRENGSAQLRDETGRAVKFPLDLSDAESILSELREPHRYPELSALRSVLLGWRFYHQFRTDFESPLRRPQIGVQTPVLSHDGTDLAAALQTILEIGEGDVLNAAVSDAFPGGSVEIESSNGGMEIALAMPEFRRAFRGSELSDGTLKYLCLAAALLSPRPPALLAINEPDANLHPKLYEPLARLISQAGRNSQVWITTHSRALATLLQRYAAAQVIRLEKRNGATVIASGELDDVQNG
ncbi:MAG: AAA family ATPase [Pirellulales bacterium]|nr:AAA family ATPase [Pirellulales bacterium]